MFGGKLTERVLKSRGGPGRVFLLAALLSSLQCPSGRAQDLEQYVASVPRASLTTNRLIARDLRARSVGPPQVDVPRGVAPDVLKAIVPSNLPRMQRSMRAIVEGYQARKRRGTLESTFLNANTFAVGTIVSASLAAAPATLGASIALGSFAAVSVAGLEYVTNEFREQQDEAARIALAASLQDYVEERNFDNLRGLKPHEILDRLEADGHPVLDENLPALSDDPAALAVANHVTMQVLARTDLEILRNLEITEGRVEETRNKLANLSRTFTEFARQTNTHFKKLDSTLEDITADLVSINSRVTRNEAAILENREDIEFLQEAMFGKMDPSEQIALIKSGGLDHLEPERQDYLLGLAETAEKRQELLNDVGSFVNGAAGMVQIAQSLGVRVPEPVANAVSVATQANQALSALATGNYIGAVVGIAGVLGKQGADAATLRHQQIMNALHDIQAGIGRIEQGQAEIMNMINGLAMNQAQIMENQQKIFDAVLDLSEQVAKSHRVLYESLDRLGRAVTVNLEGIMALRWEEMKQCIPFRETRTRAVDVNGQSIPEPFINGEFVSYDALAHHFKHFKPYLRNCLEGLRKNLASIGDSDNIFGLKFYQSEDNDAPTNAQMDFYITQVYEPAVKLLLASAEGQVGRSKPLERIFASLTAPSATISGLEAKVRELRGREKPLPDRLENFVSGRPLEGDHTLRLGAGDHPRPIQALMRTPLALEDLDFALRNLIDLHWYHDLFRDVGTMNELHPLETLLSLGEPSALGRDLVLRGVLITDVAVAQQSMLTGDLMVPIVYEALKAARETDSVPENLQSILSSSDRTADPEKFPDANETAPVGNALSANVLLWALKKEGRRDPAAQAYFVALKSNAPDLLEAQFGDHWDFYKNGDGSWIAKIGQVVVPLPTIERFLGGAFVIPNNLQSLIDLRARLIEEYLGYELIDGIRGPRRTDLGRFIIGSL